MAQALTVPRTSQATLRATGQGVAVWALLGLLLGGAGPGLAAIFLGGGAFAVYVVASELAGVVLGALVGLLDLPRRLGGPPTRGAVLSGLLSIPLGAIWAGLTGALGGLALAGAMQFASPMPFTPSLSGAWASDLLGLLVLFGGIGGALGVVVGTVPVVVFSVLRSLSLTRGWPWWTAHLGAVILAGALSIPGFLLVLGGF